MPEDPKREPSICAVVVTYNRKDLLRVAVDSLLRQTRLPNHIVIVDNQSTDGTLAMVAAEFENKPTGPTVSVLRMPSNTGGAGGFAAGIDWGHKHGFDWLWVLDDDVEMRPDCLEMMLRYSDVGDFINCARRGKDYEVILDAIWDLSAGAAVQPTGRRTAMSSLRRNWIPVQWGNFEGALIRREVVDKIGPPDARFFIAGDDSIYGFEASFYFNVIYVNELGVERRLPGPVRRNKLGYHLLLRNRFLVREHMLQLGFSSSSLVFWTSQVVTLIWAIREILADRGETKKFEMIRAVFGGLIAGAKGKFGRPESVIPSPPPPPPSATAPAADSTPTARQLAS